MAFDRALLGMPDPDGLFPKNKVDWRMKRKFSELAAHSTTFAPVFGEGELALS
jgi:hypothetical protein